MKFKSCGCSKNCQWMRCIYNGIDFEHNGEVMVGDMFFCAHCAALSIHGVPHASNPQCTPVATFDGLLYSENDRYSATDYDGVVELYPAAIEYIKTRGCKSLDLEKYQIGESP